MPHLIAKRDVDGYLDGEDLVIVEERTEQDWAHKRQPYVRRGEKRVKLTPGELEYLRWLQPDGQ